MADQNTPQEGSAEDSEKNWKALRQQAEDQARRIAELEAKERTYAFKDAGINTDHPVASMFMERYDGELSAEAIAEAAQSLDTPAVFSTTGEPQAQATPPPANPNPVRATDTESEPYDPRQDLARGSHTPAAETSDLSPQQRAYKAWQDAMGAQAPRDQAIAVGVAELVKAAQEGDQRVINPSA